MTFLIMIISTTFFIFMFIQYFSCNKIQNKENDILKIEKKINETDKKIKVKDEERNKIEEKNSDKVRLFEVWEEELKREKQNNS